MSWFSSYNPSVSLEANATGLNAVSAANPVAPNPLAWPAHDMDDGLDLPTFDLYVKCILVNSATSTGVLGALEQQVSVGNGISFNVLRRSALVIRKHADQVEFQGPSRVSYANLKPFIRELLVLHHPQLQMKKVLIGLIGFAWDIKPGLTDMLTVASPALDLEFAEHGNLAEYLKSKPLSQSLSERRMLCHQVLAGLSCLHDHHIVHGDLKMENILVCSSEAGSGIVAKLSDFGFSVFVGEIDPTPIKLPGGSKPWNSPEWRESRPSREFYKSDIYSAGLLIWAAFSLGEDPFGQGGQNIFAESELLPGDSRDEQFRKIENLKRSDKILEIACRTTTATLKSFDKGSRNLQEIFWRREIIVDQNLLEALKIVFENTLPLNPAMRSLQSAIKALKTDAIPVTTDENKDDQSTWWGPMYFSPRQASPKSLQLSMLRSGHYITIPGAPMVARLSVAISRAICLDTKTFTLARRRDAAFFLFRSYFEDYGVEESQQNIEQAVQWLHEFARLGIASEAENLCFDIAELSKRLGHDLPVDFPLESSFRTGLYGIFKGDLCLRSVYQERTQDFPNLFNTALLSHKNEGLRRLLPQQYRLTSFSTILPTIGSDNGIIEPVALLNIAASCGDIHTASLLIEKHNLDLNSRANFHDYTPLGTALRFSQTDFVLWLLRQGVKAGLQDQRLPVLCFLCNFETDDASAICNALCQGGASVNDTWYFEYRFVYLNMLSFATLAFDLATIDIMLAQQPSLPTCQGALQWACANGRLDVLMKIESHLNLFLESPPDISDWKLGLSNITQMSPFFKLTLPHRPDFVELTKYIIERIDRGLDPEALLKWVKTAIIVGDCESLCLYLEQGGSAQFLRRTQPIEGKQGAFLEKSALEWAIVFDRKALFDILLQRGSPIELEQSEGNFPTLLHSAAQRDTLNGNYFCKVLLEKGAQLEAKSSKTLSGATAFEVAMRYKNYEIADLLLHKGACIDAFEADRPTPLGELINVHSRDALAGIKFLLEHPQSKPSFIVDREHGRTALHVASGPDYEHDWQYLEGVDDHEAILDIILKYYNEPKHLNARDKCGFTALHHAAYRGCDWAVRKLLSAGADPNLQSCVGIRPLDCARQTWGLSMAMDIASPHFNISSAASENLRAAARLPCAELLAAAGAGDIGNSVIEMGLRKYLMGCFGLINNAKEDHEIYEPWTGEFPLTSVTKWLSNSRNKRSQARK